MNLINIKAHKNKMPQYKRTKRRSTRSKRKPAARRVPRLTANDAVQMNAFYNNLNPKIPDNRALLSSGRKYQVRKAVTIGDTGTMSMLLYPGCQSGLIIQSGNKEGDAVYEKGKDANEQNVFFYDTKPKLFVKGQSASTTVHQDVTLLQGPNHVTHWRIVSQALRIAITNSSHQNDGWWEAQHVTIPMKIGDYGLVHQNMDNNNLALDATLPQNAQYQATIIPPYVPDLSPDNPTYSTGKMRNIHRQLFQLQSRTLEKPFTELRTLSETNVKRTRITGGPYYLDGDGEGSRPSQHETYKQEFDTAYNCILIKLHGRATTTENNHTRILTHLVANHEEIYADDSELKGYMTPSRRIKSN